MTENKFAPKGSNIILVLVILGSFILCGAAGAFAAEKPRVGVLRFADITHAYWWSAATASDLQDMLVSELTAAKTFHVLERYELYSLLEQKFTEALLTDPKQKSKTAKTRGARYLVLATVAAFEENTNGSDNGTKFISRIFGEEREKAYLAIDVKVIDADTGTIVDSRCVETTAASGEAAKTGHSGNHPVLGGTLNKQDKTEVGKTIHNCIIEITEYLECLLIAKDDECLKKYSATGTKKKEKLKQ